MASTTRKQLDALVKDIFDEMDEPQLKAVLNFIALTTDQGANAASSADDDESDVPVKKSRKVVDEDDEDEPVVKKRKAAVEEDDDEPVVKKRKSRAVVEDEDEDDSESESEDEDDGDDEEEPVVKKKKSKAVVEDDEESDAEEEDEGEDYSSKSVAALKKLATEAGLPVKAILKKSSDEKKGLVKALKGFDETVALLMKKPLAKLLTLVERHEVEYAKPRGKASEDKKVVAAARALAAAGYPFE